MAKMTIRGLEDKIAELEELSIQAPEIIRRTLYEGAGVVADNMRQAIQGIPTDNRIGTPENPVYGIQPMQKQGLEESFGITPMKHENDGYNVLIGFDGYNGIRTKKYPGGQPNQLIARSVERGTSFRRAYPFIKKTVRSSKAAAQKKMLETYEEEVNKITK